MQAASSKTFDVNIVCVLKRHRGNGKSVRLDSFEKIVHLTIIFIAAIIFAAAWNSAFPSAGDKFPILEMSFAVIRIA
jgi:hypothetical protein